MHSHNQIYNQKGMALVLVIILLAVVTIMGTMLMFLAQTETWSSTNYRLMTQARYGAEAGANTAINYLLYSYPAPTTGGSDPLTNYVTNATGVTYEGDPVGVTYGGNAVVLNSISASANYPLSATETAFRTATTGTLTAGNTSVNYSAHATLLSMQQVTPYGSTTATTVQTWRVTGGSSISGAQNSQVEISTILERQSFAQNSYAMFASSATCGAITFSGNAIIDSYDSRSITYNSGVVVTTQSGGNIGTNGNFTENGNTTAYGTLSSPRTGVGTCNSGNPDAWTTSGKATVTGGMVQLPQAITYPPPAAPSPLPPTNSVSMTKNSTCSGIAGCTIAASPATGFSFAPGSYGNISMSGGGVLHFTAGTYKINSISLTGNSNVIIDSGPVVFNIAGQSVATPVSFSGGSVTNSSMIPMNFQIIYAGNGTISVKGGSSSAGIIYAPGATFSSAGGTDWYGEVVANTVSDTGGTSFHFDRALSSSFATVSNYSLSGFTWKKF